MASSSLRVGGADEVQVVGAAGADEIDHARFGEERRKRERLAVTLGQQQQELAPPEALPPGPLPAPRQEHLVGIAAPQQGVPGGRRQARIVEAGEPADGEAAQGAGFRRCATAA